MVMRAPFPIAPAQNVPHMAAGTVPVRVESRPAIKVAHLAKVTPHRAGLYETARDIVEAERALGLDARLVDPETPKHGKERGVPVEGHKWAQAADVWVSHSGPMAMKVTKPTIHVLHGRPFSSFMLGLHGSQGVHKLEGKLYPVLKSNMVFNLLREMAQDDHYVKFVTLWSEFLPHWRHLLPADKLVAAPAPVDLKRWTPDGPSGYGFHGKAGTINVICADMWRIDANPYPVIVAFGIFAEKYPGAKLHLYGVPPVQRKGIHKAILPILQPLADRAVLGEVEPLVSGLENVYRAADMLITPHRIATRTVREALACDCNVVMAAANGYTPFRADPAEPRAFADQMHHAAKTKVNNRLTATTHFDPANTARVFGKLIKQYARSSHGRH